MKQLLSVLMLVAAGLIAFAATEPSVISTPYGYGEDKVQRVTWSNLQGGDEGSAVKVANWPEKAVAFTGTFTGASGTIQGSIDGTNYFLLTTKQNIGVSASAAVLQTIGTNPLYIKPVITGATSGNNIKVELIMAK